MNRLILCTLAASSLIAVSVGANATDTALPEPETTDATAVTEATATAQVPASGLTVNEVRERGRLDRVEVQKNGGAVQTYIERDGSYDHDEGEGLGSRPTMRTWTLGN